MLHQLKSLLMFFMEENEFFKKPKSSCSVGCYHDDWHMRGELRKRSRFTWRRQWQPLQCFAWKIPWMEEPGRLQSMGSLRVGHDRATSLSLFSFMHWRRKWQPTPGFLPGESQERGSLMGCRLWGRTESDTTEAT